jgi:hypothetical protein
MPLDYSNFIAQSSTPVPSGNTERELGKSLLNYGTSENLIDATNSFISFFWDIAIVLIIVFIVVSGLKFITSSGDKVKAEEAKQSLKYSFIALIILILLQLIVLDYFIDLFGGGKTGIIKKPSLTETSINP